MSSAVFEAFQKYLKATFEEDFEMGNVEHLTKYAIFEAGWNAND